MLKILATGDIHIGRRPTKLADDAMAKEYSCANAWNSIVDQAIAEQVDVVALSGDVVDHANRYFEATGPLERGLQRLAERGIHTYAVAGNHDHDIFPRIIRDLDPQFFHFLGGGGKWESKEFQRDGEVVVRFHGWSFPESHHTTSPIAEYGLDSEGSIPVIGLMHADLDVTGSRYAPVTRGELAATDTTLWILGHNHQPNHISDVPGPDVLYPGSPQAMDPGEPGMRGPWLVEIEGPHHVKAKQLPVSRVLYDELTVEFEGVGEASEAESLIQSKVGEYLRKLPTGHALAFAVLRLRLVGGTQLCAELDSMIPRLRNEFERTVGDVTARIDRVVNETTPEIDLSELAQRNDPPGVLAQLLLQLRKGNLDEDRQRLLQDATRRLRDIHGHGTYEAIKESACPTQDVAKENLLRAGMLLLAALRSQRAH